MDGGERTFRANFTSDGVALLRERVKEKLQELMGEYTDDTLVEYVVVLLRNGRRKDEAAKELKVFLGGDNDAFVSWLWDHLSSNLHLYVQPKPVSTKDEAKNIRSTARGLPAQNSTIYIQTSREPEAETEMTMRVKQKREWGGIVQEDSEAVPLRSVVAPVSHAERKTYHNSHAVRRTRSPDMHHHKKRSREEDARPIKKSSHQVVGAPRRLLQFAVRDAVRPVQPVTPRSESSSKRLRSVVSTVTSDSAVNGWSQKIKSDMRVPVGTAALRAAAEAAEDVRKDKYSDSVFDRLGRRPLLNATEEPFEDGEYEDLDNVHEDQVEFDGRNQYFGRDTYMYDQETEKPVDSSFDVDRYKDAGSVRNNCTGSYQSTLPSSESKKSLALGYDMLQGAAIARSRRLIPQDKHASAEPGPGPSEKILNVPTDSKTRFPPNHEIASSAGAYEPEVSMEKKGTGSRQSNATAAHASDAPMPDNSKDSLQSCSLAEPPKTSLVAGGSYSTGQPGADSRSVFVSNVHFGATKDSLSRHFNKFGAVLKTLIMTDGVTGQPTGSAYIEFLQKESAEQALTLNGTSFMSRILKVVRKSSVDVSQLTGWCRAPRGSPFASRLIRTAYPRPTFPGAIRGRLALRGTARSLQWKRDPADSADAGKPSQTTPVTQMARSFTYTRTEPKQDVGATANI